MVVNYEYILVFVFDQFVNFYIEVCVIGIFLIMLVCVDVKKFEWGIIVVFGVFGVNY